MHNVYTRVILPIILDTFIEILEVKEIWMGTKLGVLGRLFWANFILRLIMKTIWLVSENKFFISVLLYSVSIVQRFQNNRLGIFSADSHRFWSIRRHRNLRSKQGSSCKSYLKFKSWKIDFFAKIFTFLTIKNTLLRTS